MLRCFVTSIHLPSHNHLCLSLSHTQRTVYFSLSHIHGQVKPSCYSSEVLPHKSHTLPIRYLCEAPTSPCHTPQLTQLYSGYLTPERVREGKVGRGRRQAPPSQKKGALTPHLQYSPSAYLDRTARVSLPSLLSPTLGNSDR